VILTTQKRLLFPTKSRKQNQKFKTKMVSYKKSNQSTVCMEYFYLLHSIQHIAWDRL